MRVCLLMSDLEQAEHGATGRGREWLARATRAPRDPAWIADGVVSDQWAPISPVTGRLDAFVWQAPPDVLVAPELTMSDDVTADLDDRNRRALPVMGRTNRRSRLPSSAMAGEPQDRPRSNCVARAPANQDRKPWFSRQTRRTILALARNRPRELFRLDGRRVGPLPIAALRL